MPSTYITGKLRLNPWAGDDLHIVCIIWLLVRFAQFCAILGLVVIHFSKKIMQIGAPLNGDASYCSNSSTSVELVSIRIDANTTTTNNVTTMEEMVESTMFISESHIEEGYSPRDWLIVYTYLSFVIILIDFALILSIWTASSIGTPTEPKNRNILLKPLMITKTLGLMICQIISIAIGITVVIMNRKRAWGCNEYDQVKDWEDSIWYHLFCVLLVCQVADVFIWLCCIINHMRNFLIQQLKQKLLLPVHVTREYSVQRCLTVCCQCCGLLTCFKVGGSSIQNHAEFADVVNTLMVYMDAGGNSSNSGDGLDVMFSDIYIAFKILLRVQRQRQLECLKRLNTYSNSLSDLEQQQPQSLLVSSQKECAEEYVVCNGLEPDLDLLPCSQDDPPLTNNNNNKLSLENDTTPTATVATSTQIDNNSRGSSSNRRRNAAVFKCSVSGPEIHYIIKTRSILSSSSNSDILLIEYGAHFIKYANAAYGTIESYLISEKLIDRKVSCCNTTSCCYDPRSILQRPIFVKDKEEEEETSSSSTTSSKHNYHNFLKSDRKIIYLDDIELDNTTILFIQLNNSIKETPYCILLDHTTKNIVVAIRGSASLEDFVIDVQLSPMSLQDIGAKCGFNGTGEYGHKGLVRRSVWIYDHIQTHKVLHDLLLDNTSKYKEYGFVFTGHSLGAGCAAILSIMFKSQFSLVQCYAYCPPGGLLTHNLAISCKDYVTSFINGSDIIPRMSFENLERLRDESLLLLSRIRLPKVKCLHIISSSKYNNRDDEHCLQYWNDQMLYPQQDIPHTPFYQNLLHFREFQQQKKKKIQLQQQEHSSNSTNTTNNIVNDTRLYPPGLIIHFARNSRVDELSSVPLLVDNSDFGEILITKTNVEDHSIIKLINVFEYVLNSFHNNNPNHSAHGSGHNDIDVVMDTVVVNCVYNDDGTTALKSEKEFYCCARPHGNRIFITAILGVLAFILGNFGNNECNFFQRTSISASSDLFNTLFPEGLAVSTGLWSFEQKEYIQESNTSSTSTNTTLMNSGVCSYLPKYYVPDSFHNTARASAILSSLFGFIATVMLWFASCITYGINKWRIIQSFLLLSAFFQGLVFIYFKSNLCHTYVQHNSEYWDFGDVVFETECCLGQGAKLCIAACVIWFLAALSMILYPTPK